MSKVGFNLSSLLFTVPLGTLLREQRGLAALVLPLWH